MNHLFRGQAHELIWNASLFNWEDCEFLTEYKSVRNFDHPDLFCCTWKIEGWEETLNQMQYGVWIARCGGQDHKDDVEW